MVLDRVSFSYSKEGERVVDNVSLSLPDRGLFCILGRSGSGKTTLLHLIAGVLKPTSGFVDTEGKKAALVLQEAQQIEGMTVQENTCLRMALDGVSRSKRKEFSGPVLRALGLENLAGRKANTLSGGERQRVSLASAICSDCGIILGDEPTGALDSENSEKVMEILSKMADSRLVIVVTHSVELAEKWADGIFTMEGGKLYRKGEFRRRGAVQSSFETPRGNGKIRFLNRLKLAFGTMFSRRGRLVLSALISGFSFAALGFSISIITGSEKFSESVLESFFSPSTALLSERVDVSQSQGMTLARQGELTEETLNSIEEYTSVEVHPSLSFFVPTSGSLTVGRKVIDYSIDPYLESGNLIYGKLPRTAFECVANTSLAEYLGVDSNDLIGQTFGSKVERDVPVYIGGETESAGYSCDCTFRVVGVTDEDKSFNSPAVYYRYDLVQEEIFSIPLKGDLEMYVEDIFTLDEYQDSEVRGYGTLVEASDFRLLADWIDDHQDVVVCTSRPVAARRASKEISNAVGRLSVIFLSASGAIAAMVEYYSASAVCLDAVGQCALVMSCVGKGKKYRKALGGIGDIFTIFGSVGFLLSSVALTALVPSLVASLGLSSTMVTASIPALVFSWIAMVLLSELSCYIPVFKMSRQNLQQALRSER